MKSPEQTIEKAQNAYCSKHFKCDTIIDTVLPEWYDDPILKESRMNMIFFSELLADYATGSRYKEDAVCP
ncbi:MAG: hypothetical protein K6E83_13335 [Clostridium sp.]|nr:hypothetical protein [Clostridium sp.]